MVKPTHHRPYKRSRKSNSNKPSTNSGLPLSPCLVNLPFELIAEVLLYTASPKTVLAVSRCCKYLCHTLLRPESAFIWRAVRLHHPAGPLPDPLPVKLTESAFAALVFDGGECIACNRSTPDSYSSFSLRVRFCSLPECKRIWSAAHTTRVTNYDILSRLTRKALAWIPLAESSTCLSDRAYAESTWPDADKTYLNADMQAAQAEYAVSPADVVDARHASDIARSPLKMSFYVAVFNWVRKLKRLAEQIRTENVTFSRDLALRRGYIYEDLLNGSSTYHALHWGRTKNLELITQLDYDVRAAKIEAEMLANQERRQVREREAEVRSIWHQVQQYYHRLQSEAQGRRAALPSLAEFRTLPVLRLFEAPPTSALNPKSKTLLGAASNSKAPPTLTSQLKKPSTILHKLLHAELDTWCRDAERDLGKTLGYAEWKTARGNVLHPVRRANARWVCGKCGKVGRAYRWDECLDFGGVCGHDCSRKSNSKNKEPWTAENFVKDERAINSLTQLLQLCHIDAEDPGSFDALDRVGARVLCLSCPAAIVMWPSNVVGHSHRHDAEMEMEVLTKAEADALVAAPLDKGLPKKLLDNDDFKVKEAQKSWALGCRHCEQPKRVLPPAQEKPPQPQQQAEQVLPAPPATVVGEAEEQEQPPAPKKGNEKKPKRFDFNGLRSHLKEKHHIQLPSEEDFYRVVGQSITKKSKPPASLYCPK